MVVIAYICTWICCTVAAISGMIITGKASCLFLLLIPACIRITHDGRDIGADESCEEENEEESF